MRRFRFVGNPNRYFYFNPIKGLVYDEDAINGNRTILQTSKTYPEDWEEVFEEPIVSTISGFTIRGTEPIPFQISDSRGNLFNVLKMQTASFEISVDSEGKWTINKFEIK